MATEFRCEKCGAMISTDAEAGAMTRCSTCRKRVPVPAGLAMLARPQMPGGANPGAESAPRQASPAPASDEAEAPMMTTMARAMPWVMSTFFHVGLALILMFAAMVVVVRGPETEAVTVPLATLSRQPTPWHLPRPVEDPYRRQTQRRRSPLPEGASRSRKDRSVRDPGDTNKPVKVVLGRGLRSGSGGKLNLVGLGGGIFGVGPGPGGGGGGGGGGGNVYHIVYVIDRSGSMVEDFDRVRDEMLRSISRLDPQQDFHVILFAKGTPKEMPSRRLVSAVPRNKVVAAVFLDQCGVGNQTDPIPALQRAFAVLARADRKRPGMLVHFLSDGNFPDNRAVLSAVRKLNTDKAVHINTFLYGNRPPEAEKVMKQIAAENGGFYKFVSRDEDE